MRITPVNYTNQNNKSRASFKAQDIFIAKDIANIGGSPSIGKAVLTAITEAIDEIKKIGTDKIDFYLADGSENGRCMLKATAVELPSSPYPPEKQSVTTITTGDEIVQIVKRAYDNISLIKESNKLLDELEKKGVKFK